MEIVINNQNYELGLDFTPLVNGKITALKVFLPEGNPTLRITVWNKENNTGYRTEVVNVTTDGMEFIFDISDLALIKDKEYAITMNIDHYYIKKKTNGSAAYPIIVKNFKIDAYRNKGDTDQVYPANAISSYYTGDLSFEFLQTE